MKERKNNPYQQKRNSLYAEHIYSSLTLNDYVVQKQAKNQRNKKRPNSPSSDNLYYNKQNLKEDMKQKGAYYNLLKLYEKQKELNFISTVKKYRAQQQIINQTHKKNISSIYGKINQKEIKQSSFKKVGQNQQFTRLKSQLEVLIKENRELRIENQDLRKQRQIRNIQYIKIDNQNTKLKQKLQQNQQVQLRLANFKLEFKSQSHSQQILLGKLQNKLAQTTEQGKRYKQIQNKQYSEIISLYQNKISELKEELEFNKKHSLHQIENIQTQIYCKYEKIMMTNEQKYQQKVKELYQQIAIKDSLLEQYKSYVQQKRRTAELQNLFSKAELSGSKTQVIE